MATMLFNENTNEDGSIKEEQTFCDAAATAYLGMYSNYYLVSSRLIFSP